MYVFREVLLTSGHALVLLFVFIVFLCVVFLSLRFFFFFFLIRLSSKFDYTQSYSEGTYLLAAYSTVEKEVEEKEKELARHLKNCFKPSV